MGAIGVHFGMPQRLITIAETPLFMRQAEEVWDDTEREAFVNFIAWNPEAGDVIPETAACEKFAGAGAGRAGGRRAPDEKRTVRKLAALLKGQRE
jgi:hypothetical protein